MKITNDKPIVIKENKFHMLYYRKDGQRYFRRADLLGRHCWNNARQPEHIVGCSDVAVFRNLGIQTWEKAIYIPEKAIIAYIKARMSKKQTRAGWSANAAKMIKALWGITVPVIQHVEHTTRTLKEMADIHRARVKLRYHMKKANECADIIVDSVPKASNNVNINIGDNNKNTNIKVVQK